MFVIYAAGLILWLMFMDVGAKKSWDVFNIGKGTNLSLLVARIIIAGLLTWVLTFIHEGKFNPDNMFTIPFASMFYYVVHILFHHRDRANWKDYLKINRWNAYAMLGCLIAASSSVTLS